MNNYESIVLESLSEITGLDSEELQQIKKDNIFENGILDSLSLVTLVSKIEKKANIEINISDCKLEDFASIEKIIGFISSYEK